MDKRSVQVPDIGDFQEVEVIDILVKSGDRIQEEDPLITLESDKASMDVPSPFSGTISSIHLKVGDRVSEGNLILELEEELINSEPTTQKFLEKKTPPSEENINPSKTSANPSSRQVNKADLNCEVLVLGAGPGGYTAAFRAADLGKKVILVERYESLGGV
ncbi:MAG: biotin/lipoyl-containing protein, partial [SAR324 cluster bacterium]|nr:biotin/lipoyl-containing protein [SAR324 cluster bacterium]